jgi:hypothetical protein
MPELPVAALISIHWPTGRAMFSFLHGDRATERARLVLRDMEREEPTMAHFVLSNDTAANEFQQAALTTITKAARHAR